MKLLCQFSTILSWLIISSCTPVESSMLEKLWPADDKKHMLFIGVIGFNDCLMCFSKVERLIMDKIESRQIPASNAILFMPGAREMEVRPFLAKHLPNLDLRKFSKIICSHDSLEKELQQFRKGRWNGTSGYYLFDSVDRCIESRSFN